MRMKSLFAGPVCLLWLLHAACADAADPPPLLKKLDASQTVVIPWDELNEHAAAVAKPLMERPTVVARGPAETFACVPEQYYWLLDNPDRAVTAWRRLGAKCVSINRRGPNKFGYADDTGTDVAWEVIHQSAHVRIWFAEGKVKPSAVLPLVPVKALIVLHHSDGKSEDGTVVVHHHAEVVIHTDSKAAAAVTKMMGQSAPKLAEQGLGQLQLFYSALSRFIDLHPERVELLFRPEAALQPTKKAGD
jgi:hypothetical protein